MTRWFTLTSSATYDWRSKVSNKFYQFIGIKPVAVTNSSDQQRFSTNPRRFVEVDEKGNILDKDAGGTMTRHAFSRRGMEMQPQSYTKLGQKVPEVVVVPTPEPPKPSAPRTVTSSNKTEASAPVKDEVKVAPKAETAPDVDAVSESAPAKDSAAKKSKKASKKSKKSGRKGNN